MEKRLKWLIIASLAGIALLLFLSQSLTPKILPISNITSRMLDEKVSASGNFTSIRDYINETFFVLVLKDDTGNITVIASSEQNLKDKLAFNQTYLIAGKLQKYNETLQISAEKIIALKK